MEEITTMEKPVIYALVDPRNGEVRYIGKTTNLEARTRTHQDWRSFQGNLPKYDWTCELARAGLKPTVRVLEEMAEDWMVGDVLNSAERRWIAHGRAQGWPLLNQASMPKNGLSDAEKAIVFKEVDELMSTLFDMWTEVLLKNYRVGDRVNRKAEQAFRALERLRSAIR